MIGYAPFLGQIRLATLGQAYNPDQARPIAEELKNELSQLFTEMDKIQDPNYRVTMKDQGAACGRVVDMITLQQTLADANRAIFDAKNCVSDVRGRVRSELADQVRSQATATPGPSSTGFPTWGYVVGGLAAAGLIAYLVTH